jgi:flagella synthesis protein FlgN
MSSASPHTTLQDELKLITCLIDLMKQEQQFLVAANADGLATLTPLKTQLIEQAAALAGERHRSLAAENFPESEVGMESWLARMSNPAASATWQQLLGKTREAKEQNRINGMLINKQMGHTQGALQALRPPGAAQNNFYGPGGMSTTLPRSRGFLAG